MDAWPSKPKEVSSIEDFSSDGLHEDSQYGDWQEQLAEMHFEIAVINKKLRESELKLSQKERENIVLSEELSALKDKQNRRLKIEESYATGCCDSKKCMIF